MTNYHKTFSKDDLETILMVEADRFQNLTYSLQDFKTEANAVFGEYNKNSANPLSKMFEVLRDTAVTRHTYKHTTMGFLADIEDMPNQYEYSLQFFDRYYRPEYSTIVIVGDVGHKAVLSLVKKYWSGWKRGTYTADVPAEPDQTQSAILLQPGSSPLVRFRLLFKLGAAHDPSGKEGMAALTAAMLSQGGSRDMTYEQIVQAMYPMATTFNAQVDKEMTVFYGTTHVDNLDRYYQIISGMLLDPGWREDDFARLKSDAVNFLKVNLRGDNDEELGKEALYEFIYQGHPYGHQNTGPVSAPERMTLDDLKSFYQKYYRRAGLVIGLSGGYPARLPARIQADFQRLPVGSGGTVSLPPPKPIKGLQVQIIQKETRATAISFGFPSPVNRAHPDWLALWLVRSYLGEHRSSNGRLHNRMREIRGLNYGDYACIEYFPRGMFQFHPDSNLGRHQQIFQIWIRPVEPENGHYALRIAMYELKRLIHRGLTKEEFEVTRQHLTKFANLPVKTQDQQLNDALDSQYYGIGEFTDFVRKGLAKLSLEDVNRVIGKYLTTEHVRFVVIAKDAEGFKQRMAENTPSPIRYNADKPTEIIEEDKVISNLRVKIDPDDVQIIPVGRVFQ